MTQAEAEKEYARLDRLIEQIDARYVQAEEACPSDWDFDELKEERQEHEKEIRRIDKKIEKLKTDKQKYIALMRELEKEAISFERQRDALADKFDL